MYATLKDFERNYLTFVHARQVSSSIRIALDHNEEGAICVALTTWKSWSPETSSKPTCTMLDLPLNANLMKRDGSPLLTYNEGQSIARNLNLFVTHTNSKKMGQSHLAIIVTWGKDDK